MLCCPECSSRKLYKDGLRYLRDGRSVQRFLCRDCGHRFSESKLLNEEPSKGSVCQIGAKPYAHGLVENLTELEPLKDRLAGATEKTDAATIKGRIVEFLWELEKDGKAKGTIRNYNKWLKYLFKNGVDLLEPDSIKTYLAKSSLKDSAKRNIVAMVSNWLHFNRVSWKPPKYIAQSDIPFIPTEEELNQLITAAGKKMATYLPTYNCSRKLEHGVEKFQI